jgi:hypothetical protein
MGDRNRPSRNYVEPLAGAPDSTVVGIKWPRQLTTRELNPELERFQDWLKRYAKDIPLGQQ